LSADFVVVWGVVLWSSSVANVRLQVRFKLLLGIVLLLFISFRLTAFCRSVSGFDFVRRHAC